MSVEPLTETRRLCLTVDDQVAHPYRTLPFDVPEGIGRLAVEYTFVSAVDRGKVGKESGSVIDLGLFDPRGHQFLEGEGFRGWSGSARSTVAIAPGEATPGYLSGPIHPGTWHVILGLDQIAPEGCEVTVTVTLTPGEGNEPPLPSYASVGAIGSEGGLRDGLGWYRGDLHCHSHHSDGTADVATLATVARAQGLDFLAVTEHNTVSHLPELARYSGRGLLLIPGIEITTHRGHANVWGVHAWCEFRAGTDVELRQIRERVRECGGLFSINHPKEGGPDWGFETDADADAVEAWQAPWWLSNYASLDFWERLLRQGYRPTLVGGSDKHQGPYDGTLSSYEIGTPTTWVRAEALSESAILAGIRAGHVFVSQDPRGPRLELTARAADRSAVMGDALCVPPGERVSFCCAVSGVDEGRLLRVVHKDGEACCVQIDGGEFAYTWQIDVEEDDYWRVEVIDSPDAPLDEEPAALFAFALSNPIYIRTADHLSAR
jgi:hypothetical protein